jgi:hypothetical protein
MIDLTSVLFTQRSLPRGDELLAHVSDLYGCDRATWYRRHSELPAPHTPEKQALFAQGHAYEARVAHDLIKAGVNVRMGVEVEVLGLVGHTDIVLDDERAVVDTKLTRLRKPKDFISPHYAVQIAAYAMGLGFERGSALVYHQGSDLEVQYDIHIDDFAHDTDGKVFGPMSRWYGATWRSIVEDRAKDVLTKTSPLRLGKPAPEPGEISPWLCQYCDWTQCERNPKHDPEVTW